MHEPGRFGDSRRARIGLLGGSFNPAHAGHLHVARTALRALRLDQVWLMVSPGNPLKPQAGMAPFAARLASARRIADGVRIVATAIEAKLGTRLTWKTLGLLGERFPRARFVFVIGADNLLQLPRWQRWRRIAAGTPLAVLPRPGWTERALRGEAATALRRHRRPPAALLSGPPRGVLAAHAPWSFVPARENPLSATALRASAAGGGALEQIAAERNRSKA
jgi:nicotinate-nucleotide adenylyltransferase